LSGQPLFGQVIDIVLDVGHDCLFVDRRRHDTIRVEKRVDHEECVLFGLQIEIRV